MYRVVIPMGSRAAMSREGVTDVSSRTNENIPSSMLQRPVPCSLYWHEYWREDDVRRHTHQVHDHLAVGMCLERSGVLERLSEVKVVVDFAVDGEDDGLIVVDERLGTGVCLSA